MAALGIALGVLGAPTASADPAVPVEPVPAPAAEAGVAQVSVPAEEQGAQEQGVAHLPSPENLPPGTTQTAPEKRTLGYLRDIWNAVRTEDVSMADAILLLAQRPMDSVPPGMSPRQAPVGDRGPVEVDEPAAPIPVGPAP